MKGQMKKQNGITLIALVITIIVMLILAGVSINLVVGENGVLTNAQNAVTENQKAIILEEAQMELINWQTDYLVSKTPFEGRSAQTTSGADVVCTGGQLIVVDNTSGKIYATTITEDGQIGEFTEIANDSSSQIYMATHPTIPTGYEYVDGTWNTGYVIKETSTGDEFVWVPVVSEASYAKKSGTKNWSFTTSGQWDPDNYDVVANYVTGDELGVTSILGTPVTSTVTNTKPEAAIVNAVGGFYVSRYEIGIDSTKREENLATVTKDNYNTSVTAQSKAGLEPLRYVTQEAALAIANSWKTGDNVQSGLITGTQWDVMCNFIGWSVTNSDCASWGNYYNVASKAFADGEVWHSGTEGAGQLGHWYNTAATKTISNTTDARMVFATGSFVNSNGGNTMKKNIYDVAGNVHEWTTEVTSRDNRVLRGGSTGNNSHHNLATSRVGYSSATRSGWNVGLRAVLYVTPSSAE